MMETRPQMDDKKLLQIIYASKLCLEIVLLHNGNEFTSVLTSHALGMKVSW
jgi:hypothetical protein